MKKQLEFPVPAELRATGASAGALSRALKGKNMSDIFEKHQLSGGSSVWVQRIKIPGVRKPVWSVVVTQEEFLDGPEIHNFGNRNGAVGYLAGRLRDDVCEVG